MDLQTLLNERNLSKYQLSKLSGVPKTDDHGYMRRKKRHGAMQCKDGAKAGAGSGLHDGGYDEAVLAL